MQTNQLFEQCISAAQIDNQMAALANRQMEALGALHGVHTLVGRLRHRNLSREMLDIIENEANSVCDDMKARDYGDVFHPVSAGRAI